MKDKDLIEKTISSKEIFHGKIIKVKLDTIELPNEKQSYREVVEHSGAVAIVPITNHGKVVLVKQFRYPMKEIMLEIPAGKLDNFEAPLDCAVRELEEETGYRAEQMIKITETFTSPGFSNEIVHLFLATGLTQVGQKLDEDEFLFVEEISLTKAVAMVLDGSFKDAKTSLGILASHYLLTNNKNE